MNLEETALKIYRAIEDKTIYKDDIGKIVNILREAFPEPPESWKCTRCGAKYSKPGSFLPDSPPDSAKDDSGILHCTECGGVQGWHNEECSQVVLCSLTTEEANGEADELAKALLIAEGPTPTKNLIVLAKEVHRLQSLDARRPSAEHCKDCCCARSWRALGIDSYTGESIPEP